MKAYGSGIFITFILFSRFHVVADGQAPGL